MSQQKQAGTQKRSPFPPPRGIPLSPFVKSKEWYLTALGGKVAPFCSTFQLSGLFCLLHALQNRRPVRNTYHRLTDLCLIQTTTRVVLIRHGGTLVARPCASRRAAFFVNHSCICLIYLNTKYTDAPFSQLKSMRCCPLRVQQRLNLQAGFTPLSDNF